MNREELGKILGDHWRWLKSRKDGVRASLIGANLIDQDLSGASLSGADLRGADLRGADLSEAKGVHFADCCWSEHGEKGRRLLGVIIDGEKIFFCGCFVGNETAFQNYINAGREELKESRRLAMDFICARLNAVLELVK